MKPINTLILPILLLLIFGTTAVFAEGVSNSANDVMIGRYKSVAPVATREQKDVLAVVVNINFSDRITTLGEALPYLLLRSGYALASPHSSDPKMAILLTRPLPSIQRHLGPITLRNALKTLAGPAWNLVVDPVNRLISFDLKPEYQRPVNVSLR